MRGAVYLISLNGCMVARFLFTMSSVITTCGIQAKGIARLRVTVLRLVFTNKRFLFDRSIIPLLLRKISSYSAALALGCLLGRPRSVSGRSDPSSPTSRLRFRPVFWSLRTVARETSRGDGTVSIVVVAAELPATSLDRDCSSGEGCFFANTPRIKFKKPADSSGASPASGAR